MGHKGLKFTLTPRWLKSLCFPHLSSPPLGSPALSFGLSVNLQVQQWTQIRTQKQACVGKAQRKLNNVNKPLQITKGVGDGERSANQTPAAQGGAGGGGRELFVLQAQGIAMSQSPQFTLNSSCCSTSHFITFLSLFFTGEKFTIYQDMHVLDLFLIFYQKQNIYKEIIIPCI